MRARGDTYIYIVYNSIERVKRIYMCLRPTTAITMRALRANHIYWGCPLVDAVRYYIYAIDDDDDDGGAVVFVY